MSAPGVTHLETEPIPSAALKAFEALLGPDHVVTTQATLARASTATFATTQRIPVLLRPGSRAELQACMAIATESSIPVYVVSTGKNWGYGSRVPVVDGCVLIDLS